MKSKRGIWIIVFFLIATSVFGLSNIQEWNQRGHDSSNTYLNSFPQILGAQLYNTQNITTSYGQNILYDVDEDGNPEHISVESGLLTFRDYNGTGFVYDYDISAFNMISALYVYEPTSTEKLLIGFNATHLLIYNLVDNPATIEAIYQMPVTTSQETTQVISGFNVYFFPPSVSCNRELGTTSCLMITNSTQYILFNITNLASITSINKSTGLISDIESQKPVIYGNYYGTNVSAFAILCNESGKYGVAYIDAFDGSLLYDNCSITTHHPVGDLSVRGSNLYFLSTTTTGAYSLNYLNFLLSQKSGFPITSGNQNGVFGVNKYGSSFYVSYQDGTNNIAIAKYTDTGTSLFTKVSSCAHSVDLTFANSIGGGSDYIMIGKCLYDLNTGTQGTFSSMIPGTTSAYDTPEISVTSDGFISATMDNSGVVKFYKTTPAPLNYPNITFYFIENGTGNPVQATFSVFNSSNGFLRFPTTQAGIDGKKTIPFSTLDLGRQLNVSVSTNGYLPIMYNFTLTNGSIQQNITLNINLSQTFDCGFYIYSLADGSLVSGAEYVVQWLNTTSGQEQIISQGISVSGINSFTGYLGNYSYSFVSGNYFSELFTGKSCQDLFYLTPSLSEYKQIPVVANVIPFVNRNLNEEGRTQGQASYYNTKYYCLNETIWLNVSTFKGDNESYRFFVWQNDSGSISEKVSSEKKGIELKSEIVSLSYTTNGNKTLKVYAQSETFPYTISDFDSLESQHVAISKEIIIDSSCVADANGLVNVSQPSPTADPNVNQHIVDKWNVKMASWGYKTNFLIFMSLWLLIGGLFGFALVEGTKDPVGYLYGFGVAGFFDVLFYTFIYPLLGGFILFASIMVIALVLTIKAKQKSLSNGG